MHNKVPFLSLITILFFSNIIFAQTTNDITLKPGFNFISFTNLIALNPTELKSLSTSIEDIFLFSSSAGSFLSASEGTLSTLSIGKGYIIKNNASSDIKISITGNSITSINPINLKTGFNLVGFSQAPSAYSFEKLMTDNTIIKGCYKWSPTAGSFIQVLRNELGVLNKIDGVDPAIKAGESYFFNMYSDSALTYDTATISLIPASYGIPTSKVINPVITPNGGTVLSSQQITITCATEGAEINYIIDDGSSTKYTGPLTITKNCTLKVTATKSGWTNSDLITATFVLTLNPELEVSGSLPSTTLSSPSNNTNYAAILGAKGNTISVVRSDSENTEIGTVVINATNYIANIPIGDTNYTAILVIKDTMGRILFRNILGKTLTKAEIPATTSKIKISGVNIDSTSTAMALLVKEKNIEVGKITSVTSTDLQNGIASKTSNISNEITLNFSSNPTIIEEIAKAVNTVNTTILSTNISTSIVPTNISTATELLSSFVKVIKEPSLQTFITQNQLATSVIVSQEQKIDSNTTLIDPILKVKTPVFSIMGGSYNVIQHLSISCTTSDANIKYTIDGTIPSSTNGLIFNSSIAIDKTITIKAIALKSGLINSEVASATYIINLFPSEPSIVLNIGNSVNLEMVKIQAGTFQMGEVGTAEPIHTVNISKDFYMSKFETTQGQWKTIMNGINPSQFKTGDNYPVEYVSWDDISSTTGFLAKLNAKNLTYGTFRLPTEAEWEYACRGGTTTKFYWGEDSSYSLIAHYAWYGFGATSNYPGNSNLKTHYVGSQPTWMNPKNKYGLYDMSGNVLEWCSDMYVTYPTGSVTDPNVTTGIGRVVRGGSFASRADECTSARRSVFGSMYRGSDTGFRLVLAVNPSQTVSKVEIPIITPASGKYFSTQEIVITCPTLGSLIKYTVDGSLPSLTNGMRYTSPFKVNSTLTIKAISIKDTSISDVATNTYSINLGNSKFELEKKSDDIYIGNYYGLNQLSFNYTFISPEGTENVITGPISNWKIINGKGRLINDIIYEASNEIGIVEILATATVENELQSAIFTLNVIKNNNLNLNGKISYTNKLDINSGYITSSPILNSINANGTNQIIYNYDNHYLPGYIDGIAFEPEFSFDGSQIVFTRSSSNSLHIYITNLSGSNYKNLTPYSEYRNFSPSISYDNKKVVFASNEGNFLNNSDIFVMDSDGTNRKRLTNNNNESVLPVFSPNGSNIVFQAKTNNKWNIFILISNGYTYSMTQLTNNGFDNQLPSFSPDGLKILYCSNNNGKYDIFTMNIDGTDQKCLTNNEFDNYEPKFSPDGNNIIYISNDSILTMDTNGNNQNIILKNLTYPSNLSWTNGLIEK